MRLKRLENSANLDQAQAATPDATVGRDLRHPPTFYRSDVLIRWNLSATMVSSLMTPEVFSDKSVYLVHSHQPAERTRSVASLAGRQCRRACT
jgi:hypothetical protein